MVAGTWYNQDGLYLQYGTQKPVPEIGGDYLVYGETREIETYIALVPTQWGSPATAGISPFVVGAAPTTFSGTTTALAAGIQSLNTFVPLQGTLPTGLTSGTIILDKTQLFFETVEVETLVGATGGTSLAVGLATTSQLPGTPNATFVQVTPNAGSQILNGLLTANMATPGMRATFWTATATSGIIFGGTGFATAIAGNGAWLGNVPLVTNVITPLPQSAWISAIATGTFTSGLVKLRLRYNMYGNISF
jgi:hypothetical protein